MSIHIFKAPVVRHSGFHFPDNSLGLSILISGCADSCLFGWFLVATCNKQTHDIPLYFLQCSAAGATVCYYLSYMFGRQLIQRYFPDRLAQWQIEVC
jgi:hypothetical protein